MSATCVASHHGSLADLLADPEFRTLASRPETLIELRLDQYRDLCPSGLDQALSTLGPRRVVVTFRRPDEGGVNETTSDLERVHYLLQAVRRGVAFVDVELATLRRLPEMRAELLGARGDAGATRLLISFHDFAGVPSLEDLRARRREAEDLGADVVKLAVRPPHILEGLPLLALLREENWRRPLLGLAMGEAGFWSRILGPLFPHAAPFTFARGEGAPGTAPGQPTWRELEEVYRFRALKPGWPVYGIIGNPIAHSLSPLMHNAALAALHLPGVYLLFRVEQEPLEFVRTMAPQLYVRGLSVTIPHKEVVFEVCAEVDGLARQVGAVNTLVQRGDTRWDVPATWYGANTDAPAVAEALRAALCPPGPAAQETHPQPVQPGKCTWDPDPTALRGRRVLILGAGGAARAAAFGIRALGAEVLIWGRTPARAAELAHACGGRSVSKEEWARPGFHVDAIVNTTPVGMHPHVDESPLTAEELPAGCLVYDTVYNPFRTKLLRLAEERGLRTLEGLSMFLGQGFTQFEMFTGQPAPRAVMERAVRTELEKRRS